MTRSTCHPSNGRNLGAPAWLALGLLAALLAACGGVEATSVGAEPGTTGTTGTTGGPETPPPVGPGLEAALEVGDPRQVTESTLLEAAIAEASALEQEQAALSSVILGAGRLDYAPGTSSQLILPRQDLNPHFHTLLVGNGGQPLAGAGLVGSTRVMAWGLDPSEWTSAGNETTLGGVATRALGWLAGGSITRVAIVRFGGDETGTKRWLATVAPGAVVTVCNDADQIATCLLDQPVVLLSGSVGTGLGTQDERNAKVQAAVAAALGRGQAIGYLHNQGSGYGNAPWAADLLGFELPYAGNYWDGDAAHWASAAEMLAGQRDALRPNGALLRTLRHFQAGDWSFGWGACADRECSAVTGLDVDFRAPALAVKDLLSRLEGRGQGVFTAATPRLLKLLVLLGDVYRSTVHFPIDKTVDVRGFLRALWADHTLTTLRAVNPAVDLAGSSFSPVLGAEVPVATVTRAFDSRGQDIDASAGLYAMPGRPLAVTRLDAGAGGACVFVNEIRWGANHALDGDLYDRPMHLWGNCLPIAAGQTLTLNHPVGGLLYVRLRATATPAHLSLRFAGIGQPPVYQGSGDGAAFKAALATTPFGWTEILTPTLQIHSTTAKMKESVNHWGGDAEQLAKDTWSYLYQGVYGLAGFQGLDLAQPATVTAFCAAHGWDCSSTAIHGLQGIQHFNADQANCGYLCSGQPIDSWAWFEPTGWGEAHEIGHNLQRGRIMVYAGMTSEVTNNIFPSYVWWRVNKEHPERAPHGRDLMQRQVFEAMQAAARTADPAGYAKGIFWNAADGYYWGRNLFLLQAVMGARDAAGIGESGWDLIRLMYLHERLLTVALDSDTAWAAERTKLGFGGAAFASRSAGVTPHDFLLVSMSLITGRDQRPYFTMWGVDTTQAARDQVAGLGYPAAARRFFAVPCQETRFADPLPQPLPVDGTTAWPAAAACP